MKSSLVGLLCIFGISLASQETANTYDIAQMQQWLPSYCGYSLIRKLQSYHYLHAIPAPYITGLSNEKIIRASAKNYFALQNEAVANRDACLKKINRHEKFYRFFGMKQKSAELKSLSDNITHDPDFANLSEQPKTISEISTVLVSERCLAKLFCYTYFFSIKFGTTYWVIVSPKNMREKFDYSSLVNKTIHAPIGCVLKNNMALAMDKFSEQSGRKVDYIFND